MDSSVALSKMADMLSVELVKKGRSVTGSGVFTVAVLPELSVKLGISVSALNLSGQVILLAFVRGYLHILCAINLENGIPSVYMLDSSKLEGMSAQVNPASLVKSGDTLPVILRKFRGALVAAKYKSASGWKPLQLTAQD